MDVLALERPCRAIATLGMLYSSYSFAYNVDPGSNDLWSRVGVVALQHIFWLVGSQAHVSFAIESKKSLDQSNIESKIRQCDFLYTRQMILGSHACALYTCAVSAALDIWTSSYLKNAFIMTAIFCVTKALLTQYGDAIHPNYRAIFETHFKENIENTKGEKPNLLPNQIELSQIENVGKHTCMIAFLCSTFSFVFSSLREGLIEQAPLQGVRSQDDAWPLWGVVTLVALQCIFCTSTFARKATKKLPAIDGEIDPNDENLQSKVTEYEVHLLELSFKCGAYALSVVSSLLVLRHAYPPSFLQSAVLFGSTFFTTVISVAHHGFTNRPNYREIFEKILKENDPTSVDDLE